MRHLTLALATSAFGLAAAPAQAQHPFSPATFQNIANVFNAADLDRNGGLSTREYVMLRTGTIDRSWLRNYPGNVYRQVMPAVVAGFSRIDTDNNAIISRTEFLNAARTMARLRNHAMGYSAWDWQPEYMTATYYLIANRIDADSFNGRKLVNLQGQDLGTIRDVMRNPKTGDYYALVSMSETVMDRTPSRHRTKVIGLPLDDIIFARDGASLMLSSRGERYFLMDPDLPRVNVDQLEQVDTLYAV